MRSVTSFTRAGEIVAACYVDVTGGRLDAGLLQERAVMAICVALERLVLAAARPRP
jgi:hypothetical protein